MKIHVLFTVGALALVPNLATASLPDLCSDYVYLDLEGFPLEDADGTQLSIYCDWTGADLGRRRLL